MKKRILVIEDEILLNNAINKYFTSKGYEVISVYNGKEALELFDESLDLIMVDVMLPIVNGYEVCAEIRKKSDVHIIMLTALREEKDKLFGYEHGIDEYVTKPFSLDVLYAKVRAILSRNRNTDNSKILDGITLDEKAYKLYIDRVEIIVTPKEFKLLLYFINNINIALTRDQILNHIWGYDFFGDSRVVDTHVKNLRKKLGKKGKHIKTVKGLGYRFEVGSKNEY